MRLDRATELALNFLLKRYGHFNGRALFKLSWAADDNKGYIKQHDASCTKNDPRDHSCGCPTKLDPLHTPICFHEHQACYHLLSFRPPAAADELFQSETKDDLSQGIYECTGIHFCEPNGAPINPTATIVERIVPALKVMGERALAAMYGAHATVERERLKRQQASEERERRKQESQREQVRELLREATPAFGGNPHIGYGPKTASDSERHESETRTAGADPSGAPVLVYRPKKEDIAKDL